MMRWMWGSAAMILVLTALSFGQSQPSDNRADDPQKQIAELKAQLEVYKEALANANAEINRLNEELKTLRSANSKSSVSVSSTGVTTVTASANSPVSKAIKSFGSPQEIIRLLPSDCRPQYGYPWSALLLDRANKWCKSHIVGSQLSIKGEFKQALLRDSEIEVVVKWPAYGQGPDANVINDSGTDWHCLFNAYFNEPKWSKFLSSLTSPSGREHGSIIYVSGAISSCLIFTQDADNQAVIGGNRLANNSAQLGITLSDCAAHE